MNEVIRLEKVSKYYGRSRGVIDLDLSVEQGEVYGYLGPNGAGKTTTIRLLLDLLRPSSGNVTVLGKRPHDYPLIRRRIGYLPGELNMYGSLTGRELLIYIASLRGASDIGSAEELAERLQLDLSRRIRSLSKGNKQKIGLIQALMNKPQLLILDEPTSGLDPLVQLECYEVLKEVKNTGVTIFLSSHVLPEVERLADRVAIIREGKIVVINTLTALRAKAIRRIEIRFSDNAKIDKGTIQEISDIENVNDVGFLDNTLRCAVTGSVDALIKYISKHKVESLLTREDDLESMFLSYYGKK